MAEWSTVVMSPNCVVHVCLTVTEAFNTPGPQTCYSDPLVGGLIYLEYFLGSNNEVSIEKSSSLLKHLIGNTSPHYLELRKKLFRTFFFTLLTRTKMTNKDNLHIYSIKKPSCRLSDGRGCIRPQNNRVCLSLRCQRRRENRPGRRWRCCPGWDTRTSSPSSHPFWVSVPPSRCSICCGCSSSRVRRPPSSA